MINRKGFFAAALAFAMCGTMLLTGCKGNKDDGTTVYATIASVYDLTCKIAGDKQNIKLLVTSDVHDYEPSAAEMAKLESSSMIIYNGLDLDSFVNNIGENVKAKLVDTSKGADVVNYTGDHGHSHDGEHFEGDGHDHSSDTQAAERDPHIWMYPLNAKIQLANIRDALCEYDSANSDYYNENYKTYAAKCDELDVKFKGLSGKTIVTSHNAYGYWQEKYGINVMSMDNSGDEVSPAKMKEVVDYCKSKGITVIYYEAGGSDKTASAVAAEIGGTTRALNSFETVIDGKDDYFKIMEENYEALK